MKIFAYNLKTLVHINMHTSDGSNKEVLLDVCVHIVIALRLEWRASGEDGVK